MNILELLGYLATPAAQVALIIGLVEVAKRVGFPLRFIPLLDLGLGLASGIGVYGFALGHGIVNGVLVGFALGLSACGLFSGVKNTFEKDEKQEVDNGDSESDH